MADGTTLATIAERWFPATELVGLPGLPGTERNIRARAKREGWTARPRAGRGGGSEYLFTALPPATQAALLLRDRPAFATTPAPKPGTGQWSDARIESAMAAWERASEKLRATAARRARALHAVDALVRNGSPMTAARAQVAAGLQRDGERGATPVSLWRWSTEVAGAPASAWAAILLPRYAGRTKQAPCDEQCWEWYKGDYLRRERPTHDDTYGRLKEMAAEQGWTIPSPRTLIRRLDREVDPAIQTLLRDGPEAAARMLPTQVRDVSVFVAGEAVNGDGLKLDKFWVLFEDGECLSTATAWVYQDIYSKRILAHRIGKTENTDLFRLATWDLTAVCAPKYLWVDNTRVAANKVMTAAAANRHRFRDDPADGMGLLPMLGIEVHFTNPDHEVSNPGVKPVERAFGIGGLHTALRTNPRFANRGFSRATAVPIAEIREAFAEEVIRHNARTGRRTAVCGGVLSFDQAWQQSREKQSPRLLTESQRRLLLMSREVVTVNRPHGHVTLKAGRNSHGANQYWCEALTRHMGAKLVALFDPENLSAGVHLYTLDGRYLVEAAHRPTRAFNSVEAGRETAKFRQRINKARKQIAADEVRMGAIERAALYDAAVGKTEPAPPPSRKRGQKVVQGVFQRVADPARDAQKLPRTGTDDGPSRLDELMFAMRPKRGEFDP